MIYRDEPHGYGGPADAWEFGSSSRAHGARFLICVNLRQSADPLLLFIEKGLRIREDT